MNGYVTLRYVFYEFYSANKQIPAELPPGDVQCERGPGGGTEGLSLVQELLQRSGPEPWQSRIPRLFVCRAKPRFPLLFARSIGEEEVEHVSRLSRGAVWNFYCGRLVFPPAGESTANTHAVLTGSVVNMWHCATIQWNHIGLDASSCVQLRP